MLREIPKHTTCPPLTPELTRLLTKLAYLPNSNPFLCDVLLVFGNRNFSDTADYLSSLLTQGISRHVIISGGTPRFDDSYPYQIPESEEIFSLLSPTNYPQVKFHLEKNSTNTLENVSLSLSLFPRQVSSIAFSSLWYVSRRAHLSLRKFFPDTPIFSYCFPKKIPEENVILDPQTWTVSQIGRDRTYAEYLRIKLYASRGDIAFDPPTQSLVSRIDALV